MAENTNVPDNWVKKVKQFWGATPCIFSLFPRIDSYMYVFRKMHLSVKTAVKEE